MVCCSATWASVGLAGSSRSVKFVVASPVLVEEVADKLGASQMEAFCGPQLASFIVI